MLIDNITFLMKRAKNLTGSKPYGAALLMAMQDILRITWSELCDCIEAFDSSITNDLIKKATQICIEKGMIISLEEKDLKAQIIASSKEHMKHKKNYMKHLRS